jgi:hypothetical protein
MLQNRDAAPNDCLQILRKRQAALVRGLELKIRAGASPSYDGVYVLSLDDLGGLS